MALASGARLGPYEVNGVIGSGGMGVVYKAKDTRLDRTVAIKVLPEDVASTPELRDRFEREAKAISRLNHPHICTLHDVGSQNGIDFLVMEYLEGETLAERLSKGALPPGKSLEFGVQIADALVEAHRAGIVHRDLKPGNAMLTKSGVKLLDFGLAKLVKNPAVSGESDALTQERTLVGTLRYMAPEQLEGKSVDARADLWAFGMLLYEMLTGKSAFGGGSPASLMSAILKDEPVPLSTIQPLTPRPLERLVQKCLRKDPEDRWQTARDLKDELVWIGQGEDRVEGASAPGRGRWSYVAIAGGTIVATLLLSSLFRQDPGEPGTVKRFAINLPPGQSLASYGARGIAISPDGESVVFPVALEDGRTQLYWRSIGNLEATPLRGTEGAGNPFFSPDGEWVAFYANGALEKIRLTEGSSSSPICVTTDVIGASWEPDGTIWFSDGRLHRVPSSGGKAEPVSYSGEDVLTSLGGGLPGGKGLLLFGGSGRGQPTISVLSLESLEIEGLLEGGIHPRYASSGHIVFEAGDRLMAAPFDPARLELRGPALPVLQDLRATRLGSRSAFDVSNEGTLVYVPSFGTTNDDLPLYWVDRTGAMTLAVEISGQLLAPRLSPDGRSIAMQKGTDVWTLDLARDALSRLTLGEGVHYAPVWSRDGSRLFFSSGGAITFRAVDGRGATQQLISGSQFVPTSVSSDGKTLVFSRLSEPGGWDVGTISLEGNGGPRMVLETRFNESFAVLSPDDRFLAYVSDESGTAEVYLLPFRGDGGRVPVSTNGGTEPMWSRDGRELYYRLGEQLMAASVSPGAEPELGKPSMLFQGHFRQGTRVAQYDVSTDGRFLMVGESPADRIHVVLNWFEELKRLAPAP
jgi:serine/threonine-protein kinase